MTESKKRNGGGLPTDEELRRRTPPASGRKDVRVGIFVITGLLGVLVTLFLLTDPATFRGRYRLVTAVEDAGGIRNGDPVRMHGVNIGRVRGFEMIPGGEVRIGLEIEGEWTVPEDSRTQLVSAGVMGGRTVDILPGTSPRQAERGALLPGTMVPSVLESADDFGGEALDIMARVRLLLSDTTLAAVESGATELESLLAELSGLVREQRGEVATLTASLGRSAAEIEAALEGGAPDLASALARADSAMRRLETTSGRLDSAADALAEILTRIREGEGTLGMLVTDDALYRNLSRAGDEVAELAADIRANPGRYIRVSLF